ncbi:ATP-binding protein [Luteimonas arsenica]|uniref:ATP-binding protein n=1 Tax=Luteimonas arsenica TaxID=1586242 RepID=UPI001056D277|nr:ATP-binding protein [Luteimonas arsenica]
MEHQELNTTTLTRTATCNKHGEYEEVQKECYGPGKDEFGDYTVVKFLKWTGHCAECVAEIVRREEEHKAKMERHKLHERIRASGIPGGFLEESLDSYIADNPGQQKALSVARDYVANFGEHVYSGRNLLFTGKPGCGKTHLAVAIGMALMKMGASVRWTTASDMTRRFTDTWGRREGENETQVLADLTGADLLILDEAGVQSGSEVELRTIFNVIDGRYREKLPTLVASNLSIKNLTPYVGERVIDRLRDNGSELVAFDWESYRGKKGARNTSAPRPFMSSAGHAVAAGKPK